MRILLVLTLLLLALPSTAYADAWTIVPTWLETVEAVPECWDLPTELVLGVIHVESNGVANTTRSEGERGTSYGLMQIMDRWATTAGWLLVPSNNIAMGCRIITSVLEQENGDMRRTLARYNCGLSGLNERGCGLPYADEILDNIAPQYATIIAHVYNVRRIEALMEIKVMPHPDISCPAIH